MTGGPDNESDRLYDGPCSVCGETVLGRPYLALGLFAAVSEEGDALHFTPDDPPAGFQDWDDVSLTNCVHVDCFQNYHDGLMADLAHRRRRGETEQTE